MTRTATATRKATLAEGALFVIFSITTGCECCKPGPRETVVPAAPGPRETVVPAAPGRTRDALRELLAFPHRVNYLDVVLHVVEPDVELSRESMAELRASAAR
jgi:hypothetical protein